MAISAKVKYLRIAPRKMRMVADLIRNKPVGEARAILRFTARKASEPLLKLLDSSIANAKNNLKKDTANLYISEIFVDGGPMQKRTYPRSRGRADMIKKRSSHVTIVLKDKGEDMDAVEPEKTEAKKEAKDKKTKKISKAK